MAPTARFAANAYAKIGVQTGVAAASPHRLILMLFDEAINQIAKSRKHMEAGNIAEKGEAISKAIKIIDEGLRANLDTAAGDLANTLDSLYDFSIHSLIDANLNNDPAILSRAHDIFNGLRESWAAIEPDTKRSAQTAPRSKPINHQFATL
jgi:flagellar protein FliS